MQLLNEEENFWKYLISVSETDVLRELHDFGGASLPDLPYPDDGISIFSFSISYFEVKHPGALFRVL